ncbi:glycosyltransferase family 25 protein [Marinomonas flavescens]|uniref:glycosyltransferase family 25 protein n=1 Tax=Marinomonas flavescens TaxID=2529379 RepID=UPI001A9F8F89|nr:glycosyltransferase family 25 protein [Marinomonas flavescens]
MNFFVISLKRSTDRRISIEKALDEQGLEFYFFDAADGRDEPPHELFRNYNYSD